MIWVILNGWGRFNNFKEVQVGPSNQGSMDQNRSVPEKIQKSSTEKNSEIQDQAGPGPNIFRKPGTNPDQDQIFLENLGPTRTGTKYFHKISDQLGPGPKSKWNLGPTGTKAGRYQSSRTDSDQNIRFVLKPHPFYMRNRIKIRLFDGTAFILNTESDQNWSFCWNRIRFECGIGSISGYFLKLHPVQMRNWVKIGLFTKTASVLNADLGQNRAISWNYIRFECRIGTKYSDWSSQIALFKINLLLRITLDDSFSMIIHTQEFWLKTW